MVWTGPVDAAVARIFAQLDVAVGIDHGTKKRPLVS